MKTIGIIGGMGPLATVDLFGKIVNLTDAKCDNDHIHILIDNNTYIPDRTSYILGDGKNPLDELVKSAKRLKDMGADFLVMPCNTAHYFYNDIINNVSIPFINMIEETASYINNKKAQKVLTDLRHKDVEYVILGCTELPVAFELLNLSGNFIDPTEVLAKAAIKKALY